MKNNWDKNQVTDLETLFGKFRITKYPEEAWNSSRLLRKNIKLSYKMSKGYEQAFYRGGN